MGNSVEAGVFNWNAQLKKKRDVFSIIFFFVLNFIFFNSSFIYSQNETKKHNYKNQNHKVMDQSQRHSQEPRKTGTSWRLKKTKLNVLLVFDDRYINAKIKTYGDQVYTIFRGLNVPEDDIECESFTVISIDSLLLYENNITCKYI